MMCTAQQQGKYLGKVCDIYYAGGMLRSEYTHISNEISKIQVFLFYHKGMETANSQHKS